MTLCVLPQVVGEVTSSVTVSAPCHHRPAAPAHDPHQSPALIIIYLTHPQASRHRASPHDQQPAQPAAPQGKRELIGTS